MGRMKEYYMEIMEANDGKVPEELTIADVARMKELRIFNWQEYEREQEKVFSFVLSSIFLRIVPYGRRHHRHHQQQPPP